MRLYDVGITKKCYCGNIHSSLSFNTVQIHKCSQILCKYEIKDGQCNAKKNSHVNTVDSVAENGGSMETMLRS